jgi:hypothetical protein
MSLNILYDGQKSFFSSTKLELREGIFDFVNFVCPSIVLFECMNCPLSLIRNKIQFSGWRDQCLMITLIRKRATSHIAKNT